MKGCIGEIPMSFPLIEEMGSLDVNLLFSRADVILEVRSMVWTLSALFMDGKVIPA